MKKMSLFALLLAAVLVTSYSVSGTYAKYTSTFSGTSDSARVAKWAFEINDGAVTDSFTFNLFDTVNDTKTSAAETDVKVGEGETIIAPGTTGSFDIKLENLSEVNATYTVDYTVTNTNSIPVEFKVGDGEWSTELADVTTPVAVNMGGQDSITIQWRWTFEEEGRDAADTLLGSNGTAKIEVKADITVIQVD